MRIAGSNNEVYCFADGKQHTKEERSYVPFVDFSEEEVRICIHQTKENINYL